MPCLGSGLRFAKRLPRATPWVAAPRPSLVAWPTPSRTVSTVLLRIEFRAMVPPASNFVVSRLGCRGDYARNVSRPTLEDAVLGGGAEHHLALPQGLIGAGRLVRRGRRPDRIACALQGEFPAPPKIDAARSLGGLVGHGGVIALVRGVDRRRVLHAERGPALDQVPVLVGLAHPGHVDPERR